jgi:AMMECR1
LRHLEEDLESLAEAALTDARFGAVPEAKSADVVSVSVAFLDHRVDLGTHSVEDVVRRIRHGEQALLAVQESRSALFLPSVVSRFNLSPADFVKELLKKAGISRPPYRWIRFECTAWLAESAGERLLSGSFALHEPPDSLKELVERLAPLGVQYLRRHQRPDGTFFVRYEPFQCQLYEGLDLPRLAHAAWVLARAAKSFEPSAQEATARALAFLSATIDESASGIWLGRQDGKRSVAEVALFVLALCEGGDAALRERWVPRLAAALWSRIGVHGRIKTHELAASATDAFQDYFPGQTLLALASAARMGLTDIDEARLSRAFQYYRHRFSNQPHFGQVSWMAQACFMWRQVKPGADIADFGFEIVEWILSYQHEKTGAFINDHQADTPGYTSALYLEAIAAGALAARAIGKRRHHRRYLESCRRGLQFLDALIIQPRDSSLLPDPAMAIGGLRRSARVSEIRIDFVQHYLAVLVDIRHALQSQ